MIDENQYISTSVKQKQQTLTAFIQHLHEEHNRILKALDRVQRDVAFYQPYYEKYRQVEAALKKGYAETPKFKPEFSQKYLETIRSLVVQSVYSRWNQSKQPSTLLQIYRDVSKKIRELIKTGRWPRNWKVPGKRTIDRRVNEAADHRFWPGRTPIIAIKAGLYMVNPLCFDGETKRELQQILAKWRERDD